MAAIIHHCILDLLIITKEKDMDQGKEMENVYTQETVLGL